MARPHGVTGALLFRQLVRGPGVAARKRPARPASGGAARRTSRRASPEFLNAGRGDIKRPPLPTRTTFTHTRRVRVRAKTAQKGRLSDVPVAPPHVWEPSFERTVCTSPGDVRGRSMKLMISKTPLTKAALALALAAGGTALQAQDTDTPPPPASEEPAAPAPAPEPVPTDPVPEPAPAPEPVDQDGDGIDDVTGEPIPQEGDTAPEPQ